jgi:hypothetical protein
MLNVVVNAAGIMRAASRPLRVELIAPLILPV